MYENQRHNVVALGRRRVSLIVADTKHTHTQTLKDENNKDREANRL